MPAKAAARTRHVRRAARVAEAAPMPAPEIAQAGGAGIFRPTLHAQIRPDPANPRQIFDEDGLEELAASIARDGLLEPLVLRGIDDEPGTFMLIAGERRWRAIGNAIEAGDWPAEQPIPAMLRDVSEEDARRLALVENLQRRDLNPVEEARALQQLQALTGKSAAEIGRELGFTERWAQQRLALLKLPESLQSQVERKAIKLEEARDLPAMLAQLPAIKLTELERGAITVAQAKEWLAKQPKPLDLAPDVWLLALEIYDKTERLPIEEGGRYVEVHADARFDERIRPLTNYPSYLLYAVSHVLDDGGETGRFQIGVTYEAERQFRLKFGDSITAERGRLRALDALYAELGVAHTPPLYRTTWLNGPFEITESLRAEIDGVRQERATREAGWKAERDVEDARRAADQAALRARFERAKAGEAELLQTGNFAVNAPKLCAEIDAPLPWFLDEQTGIILAANGQAVTSRPWQLTLDELARLRLVVTLANAGAGLVAPARAPMEAAPEDEDPMSRQEFERLVASFLCEDMEVDDAEAAKLAASGLKVFLREVEYEFGDPRQAWTYDSAMDLAARIRVEGLGQQVDLEEAIAATEGPALSPALLALAGVPAQV